jgi:ABC-2 type transport system permease protein
LTIALGVIAYGVTVPDRSLGLVVTVATAGFCFSALGVAISTFVPNEDAAPAIINFPLFPLLFISGTFGKVADSSALGRIAAVFPVRHLVKQMVAIFDPFTSGSGVKAADLAIMLIWGVVGVAVSLRRFRWEPSGN